MKKITISYPDEQYELLEQHPEINKSGLFRARVGYLMKTGRASLNSEDFAISISEICIPRISL